VVGFIRLADRQTRRQIDKKTQIHTSTLKYRLPEVHIDGHTHKCIHIDKQTSTYTDKEKQTHRDI